MDVHGDRYQPALLLPLRLRLDVHGGIPDLRAPGQGRTSSCMPYLLGHIRHTVPISLSLKKSLVSPLLVNIKNQIYLQSNSTIFDKHKKFFAHQKLCSLRKIYQLFLLFQER